MKHTIYVVVHVTYDWYRFQENITATTSFVAARMFASQFVKDAKHAMFITDDEDQTWKLNDSETEHLWIQKLKQP